MAVEGEVDISDFERAGVAGFADEVAGLVVVVDGGCWGNDCSCAQRTLRLLSCSLITTR